MTAVNEPTRQDEAWRYIETTFLSEHPKGQCPLKPRRDDLPAIRAESSGRVVFRQGRLDQKCSNAKVLEALQYGEMDAPAFMENAREKDWYASRHRGTQTKMLELPKGVHRDPLEVLIDHQGADAENRTSLFFRLPRASEHRLLIRTSGSDENYLANLEWGLELEDGAQLKLIFDQEDAETALVLTSLRATLGRDANLKVQYLAGKSRLVRHRMSVDLMGENAEVFLSGVGLCDGDESLHHYVEINHKVPNARSRQLFKMAMQGSSRSSFDGTIEVDRGSDGTDANQLCRYLMLNDKVRASAKPQLKIYADDVACAHGATVGQLEEDERFYLVSRGLDPATSNALLVRGFLTEALEEGPMPKMTRDWQDRILSTRLPL